MTIQAIKQNGKEKLLAIAERNRDGQLGTTFMCDWNTRPNMLRIFDQSGVRMSAGPLKNFGQAVALIFALKLQNNIPQL